MRDATGERAHRLEPLRVAQFELHLSELLLAMPALRHVLHEAHHADGLARAVEEHAAARLQPVQGTVGMPHAVLVGDVAAAVGVLDRFVDRRPVIGMHQCLPALIRTVVGARREPVHGLEIGGPAVLALTVADRVLDA